MARKSGGDNKAPNVKLAGDASPEAVEGEVNIGMSEPIYLPSEGEQRKGFYCEEARALIRQFPGKYKAVKPLGGGS